MKVPIVNSPLGIIALFVALVEAFLAYDVTQLQGDEQHMLIIFMIIFPSAVALMFFIFVWFKPSHLYPPREIPPELRDRFQAKAAEVTAYKVAIQELQEEILRLQKQQVKLSEQTIFTPSVTTQLTTEVRKSMEIELEKMKAEILSKLQSAGVFDESTIEKARVEVEKSREQIRHQITEKVLAEMSKFREWLASRGFKNLPGLPQLRIEISSSAFYMEKDNSIRIGSLLADDLDAIATAYLGLVVTQLMVAMFGEYSPDLHGTESYEVLAGTIWYYACSYKDNPVFGEKSARVKGVESWYIGNLEEIVKMGEDKIDKSKDVVRKVWSGACWEFRKIYGGEKIDNAVRITLFKLTKDLTVKDAALILRDELVKIEGEKAKEKIREVFAKRGVEFPT